MMTDGPLYRTALYCRLGTTCKWLFAELVVADRCTPSIERATQTSTKLKVTPVFI